MNTQEIRDYFLSKAGAKEETPFNIAVPVFKVGEKMFGLINIHEPERKSMNLKYPKDRIHELRSLFEEVVPGYHMNKDNWNTVYYDGQLDEAFIKQLMDMSYDLVFASLTKKKQKEIAD